MELAGLAQLDDQNTHSRPEQLPTKPGIHKLMIIYCLHTLFIPFAGEMTSMTVMCG